MRLRRPWTVALPALALAGCLDAAGEQTSGAVQEPEESDAVVGAIEIRGVLRCSAVLVDEWHVATAAYCLPATHLDHPELLGRSEMFFVTGAATDAPDARRIPIVAHEVMGAGIPEPHDADLGIGRLAEPVAGPFLPLAPRGAVWPEWTTRMRVVSMGAPTSSAPFGARRAVDLEVAATSAALIALYRPEPAFCMVDMGGALIATIDGEQVLAGVVGHWATRGGDDASNGDWCSPAAGQALATRTERGSVLADAAARLDAQTSFAAPLTGPGSSGQWLVYESGPLEDGAAHGTGIPIPAGSTTLVVDLVVRPGDPIPQLAVARERMPSMGQAPACEALYRACAQGEADACAEYDTACVLPVYLDADCLPVAAERQTCVLAAEGAAYLGISVSNTPGDRPATYAVAAWTQAALSE